MSDWPCHPAFTLAPDEIGLTHGDRVELPDPSSPLHTAWLEEAARVRGQRPSAAGLSEPSRLERTLRERAGVLAGTEVVGVYGAAGSGRTSVVRGLALAFARAGRSVAVLDADLETHALRARLGYLVPPLVVGGLVLPYVHEGVRVQSLDAFFFEPGPLPWQGRELERVLGRFREDVLWANPDVLLLDMPPLGDPRLGAVAQFFGGRFLRVEGALESAAKGPTAVYTVRNAAQGEGDAVLPYLPAGDLSEIFATRLASLASALGVKGSGSRS